MTAIVALIVALVALAFCELENYQAPLPPTFS